MLAAFLIGFSIGIVARMIALDVCGLRRRCADTAWRLLAEGNGRQAVDFRDVVARCENDALGHCGRV